MSRAGPGGDGGAAGRAQSNAVGVALIVGLTLISLGAVTAAVGTAVGNGAAAADAERVAEDLDAAIRPVEATGHHEGRVAFADGRLETVDRTLRVLDGGTVVAEADVGGLAYETRGRRVLAVGGAVVHDAGARARMASGPPIAAGDGVLLVGAAVAGDEDRAVSAGGPTTVRIVTNVEHDRTDLGEGEFAVAIETDAPAAWEREFESMNATVDRRRFAGDDHESVVATFDGERRGYFVVHRLNLEVRDG